MKKFEIGKEYFDRSACNHDCIFTIKIIKRTEKTVTFERNGKTRRAKLFFDERGEYIIPERYSMARSSVLKTRFSRKRNPASRKPPPKRPAALKSPSPPT